MVFDLGGGTFDTTLLSISKPAGVPTYTVVATDGDTRLGGKDFDELLLRHVAHGFKERFQKDPYADPKSLRQLRLACEKAKEKLTKAASYEIEVDNIMKEDFTMTITRAEFNEMIEPLLQKAMACVDNTLKAGRIKKENLNDIILVGGSTRIPRISELLEEKFSRKPCQTVDPDEAVAMGAALAASVGGESPAVILNDVTPLSLGVLYWKKESQEDLFQAIIPRNTPVPTKQGQFFKTYTTMYDDQPTVDFKVKMVALCLHALPALPAC